MDRRKKVTIKDIAKIAQVSYSTVSRCLNGSELVSEDTRQKVLKIAEETGFGFNASARGLSTNRQNVIGLVLPENYQDFNVSLYHSGLLTHVRSSLERMNYDLMVTFLTNRYTGQNSIQRLVREGKVDGLIMLQQNLSVEMLQFLYERRFPVVFSHYPVHYQDYGIVNVYSDNLAGGALVADRFISCGRKKALCLSSLPEDIDCAQRMEGFRSRFEERGGEVAGVLKAGSRSFSAGYELVVRGEDRLREIDCLFAVNDLMALGAMKRIRELGLGIPEDIALVGYDDSPLVRFNTPGLTSVNQHQDEIALLTCEKLIRFIEQGSSEGMEQNVQIKPELVIRESC